MKVKREYYSNGQIFSEEWWEKDKLHKVGRPARILYYLNGGIRFEGWWENDRLHRIGKPARIWYAK